MFANRMLRFVVFTVAFTLPLAVSGGSCLAQESSQESLPNPFDLLPAKDLPVKDLPVKESKGAIESASPTAASAQAMEVTETAAIGDQPIDLGPTSNLEPETNLEPEINDSQQLDVDQPLNLDQSLDGDEQAADEQAAIVPAELKRDPRLNKPYSKAYVIDLQGPIFGQFHWFLNQRLDRAKELGADLVILRLTTPGGDLEQSLQLARRLRDIDWATTVVFIPEEAISGGAIISLGCDFIFMRKGALIGDAGPIRFGPNGQFEHAEEKIVSFLASAVRELAQSNNRPAGVAEAMVDRSVILYSAVELATGKLTVLSEAESLAVGAKQRYRIGDKLPESGQNRFLTVGAERAQELALCEGVFATESEMLEEFTLTAIEQTKLNWIDRTVFILNRPWLTAILLIVGLVGLYLELVAPGISVAGLVATLCFGIFFWSHALGGTSGWLEVLLFVLGVGCLICELFVLPGFGIFGLTGLSLLVVSLVMASQDFLMPTSSVQWNQLQTNTLIVLGAVLGVLLLFIGQVVVLDSIPGFNRFRLSTPDPSEMEPLPSFSIAGSGIATPRTVIERGAIGIADSDLRPSGKVVVGEVLIDVVTEGDFVDVGSTVEVIRVEGNRVVVRKTATNHA